jgi:hypothetical protein
MNDKIREVALRVARDEGSLRQIRHKGMDGIAYHFETDDELVDFLTRGLDELSKDVEPVAWLVMNGLVSYQLFHSCSVAHATAKEMQKRHDLSGSLASFSVQPLYFHPPLTEQDKLDAEPELICPHCKVDRLKEPCPDLSRCKFIAAAYSNHAMENGNDPHR